MDLAGARAVVIGLGISGRAVSRLMARRGARVLASDAARPSDPEGELKELERLGVAVETGGHSRNLLDGADLVVLSPGVDPSAGPAAEAIGRGMKVLSEVEVASWFFEGSIVGITGSNGKSTTTALAAHLLKGGGVRAVAGGNLGRAFSRIVEEEPEADVLVLELSSFQLERVDTFRAETGVLLNITPDHLDRYPDMTAYAAAKARLWEGQVATDWAIHSADDPGARDASAGARGLRIPFTTGGGAASPGVWVRSESGRSVVTADLPGIGGPLDLFEAADVPLPGMHNLGNAMAAATVAARYGVSPARIQEAMRSFRGLPHRLELVGEADGVRFYNDSKATNVESAVAALSGFPSGVVLIAGGKHKGSSYGPLREPLGRCGRAAVLIGQAADRLADDLEGCLPLQLAGTMAEAVIQAFALARPDGVVLLAPACSSFDMFDDYTHRGRTFTEAARRIIDREKGVS